MSMDTKVIKVNPEMFDDGELKEACEILKRNGLVAFPTETVYGLGGDGMHKEASAKIYAAKGRPSDNPLIIHIADRKSLDEIASEVSKKAEKLMDAFWPGPMTLIFRKKENVPMSTTGGLETVAVRMPSHPVARELIRQSGVYIAAPSANTSGRPSPTKAEHVIEDLSGKIDMIIDGGSVGIGLESTIVDMSEDIPVILRPGYITKKMLEKAEKEHYAVAQININNLEWTKAVLEVSQELNSPVILGVSEGAGKYMGGYKTVVGMVKGMLEELNITVPVSIHLDHGGYDACIKCIEAGFPSIMYDGSHDSIEENLKKTKEIVEMAHAKGITVEAEVGAIGGEEDGKLAAGECADPEECREIAETGIDLLAAGIGNIHGKYPANWEGLSFETLDAVQQLTGEMPLVLHGGTGIPDDMIKKAISLGVAKINVNTECQLSFAAATRKYIEEGKDNQGKGYDPRKLLAPGFEAIKATVKEKMELFGSVGKAE